MLIGCGPANSIGSGSVDEKRVHRTYRVEYDASSRTLTQLAQFRVGGIRGVTVELEDSSYVSVENNNLSLTNGRPSDLELSGSYYERQQRNTELSPNYRFEWQREDGVFIADHVAAPQPIRIADRINLSKICADNSTGQVQIPLDGSIDDSREYVFAKVVSDLEAEEGQQNSVTSVGRIGNSIVFQRSDLKLLPEGNAQLYIERRTIQDLPPTENDGGAYMASVYKAAPRRVSVACLGDILAPRG
jgi:hypothetical protein